MIQMEIRISRQELYQCGLCEFIFNNLDLLNLHMNQYHMVVCEKQKLTPCEIPPMMTFRLYTKVAVYRDLFEDILRETDYVYHAKIKNTLLEKLREY
jgi:hypothetical protein